MPETLLLPAGTHNLNIKVWNQSTPPAIYVKGKTVNSDATWRVTYEDKEWIDESGKASHLALQHIRVVKNPRGRAALMHGPLATRGILVDSRQKRKARRVQNRVRDGKHIGIKGILRVFLLEQPHIRLPY